jgi:hypothetical protein
MQLLDPRHRSLGFLSPPPNAFPHSYGPNA